MPLSTIFQLYRGGEASMLTPPMWFMYRSDTSNLVRAYHDTIQGKKFNNSKKNYQNYYYKQIIINWIHLKADGCIKDL